MHLDTRISNQVLVPKTPGSVLSKLLFILMYSHHGFRRFKGNLWQSKFKTTIGPYNVTITVISIELLYMYYVGIFYFI